MKMETKERRKFSTDNQKHLGRKQSSFLQFETLSHYRNRYIESHYKNNISTRKRIDNIYIKNHELSTTKLRDLRKRNTSHHLNS